MIYRAPAASKGLVLTSAAEDDDGVDLARDDVDAFEDDVAFASVDSILTTEPRQISRESKQKSTEWNH